MAIRAHRRPWTWTAWDPSSEAAPKFIVFDTQADGRVRMSSGALTTEAVVADIETDPRSRTQDECCQILREMAIDGRGFTVTYYAKHESCREYPLPEVALGGS